MWNYFTIKWLCEVLSEKLIEYKIGEIFSQNKNEIIFGFYKSNAEDFYWILNFEPSFPHMRFSNQYSRAKRNSADLFVGIIDQTIIKVQMHEGERSFHFDLGNGSKLIFKMHGGRANVLVKKRSENHLFRTNIKNDLDFEIPPKKEYSISENGIKDQKELKEQFPILDKDSVSFLEKQNIYQYQKDDQEKLILALLEKLQAKEIFISRSNEHWLLHQIKLNESAKSYLNLFEAINDYSSIEGKERYISGHKESILKELKVKSERINKSIQRMNSRLDSLINNNEWEEKANLIMANLHLFSDGNEEAEVFDFYNDLKKKIKIKKGISAQKYAESLYKKSKNKGIEIKKLESSIFQNTEELKLNNSKIEAFEEIQSPKEIKEWISREKPNSKGIKEKEESLFKEFRIKEFQIFVGKNAKNNDVLTTKFAKKDDLWMHAKDVSGSHLIIRKDKNSKVPKDVLEQAASIAAWYSKGKNDTLFPVIYTDRKYVRKGKGLAPGQVFVDKYDVIIVKPELP